MFNRTRYQLLLAYLLVLTIVLSSFAIAVRTTFTHNLNQQLNQRLQILATALGLELEREDGQLVVENETALSPTQAVQWFDAQGQLLEAQGSYKIQLPFKPQINRQTQIQPQPATSLTQPVTDQDSGNLIGYVRVSESTQPLQATLRSLDLGLGSGIALSLLLSGIGGIWLIRQAMQPIEQSFHHLQRFTSDASHELRSPLMAIRANVEVALKYDTDMRPADAEKFRAVQSAVIQLTDLTEDLLALARVDQVNRHTQQVIHVRGMITRVIELYQAKAQQQQVQLTANISETLFVLGDKTQLLRLLINLLENALRHTPTNGQIHLQSRSQGKHILISIQDSGSGIAPEHLPHIFERFWQADRSRSYQTRGFGLGLAIAQNIAQKHGGNIQVTSQLGQGSCFTIALPRYAFPAMRLT
ncbi:HAMP domain-containing histidine kinase [filamentous cyanobacterium LEGE 11480]|uniref:histidine kinase n=1 Tax=Romeriopsis navalis LEGE 11480 TaxID=2777977 RepID=A0A928VMA6_9CYAN|nr:HAMP domain-containing sensor histidine kinase [Romeriopsis navalis]MBE9029125.1 HAMP domain-containing histidine kinase [Romeriopsis navalis LEGE 11480]